MKMFFCLCGAIILFVLLMVVTIQLLLPGSTIPA